MTNIPENVKAVCGILKKAGFEAYLVGGCVRDYLRDVIPKDYDITTNALPDQIRSVFRNAGAYILDIHGAEQHGVVFLYYHRERFEIATFRGDKEYTDGRHCDIITGVSLEEDLSRRDFTINAMAMDPFTYSVTDPFGGQTDLIFKRIRAVGNPVERFNEDGLRILRAFRFSAQLGFSIVQSTLEAAKECKDMLNKVSAERKGEELIKILCADPNELYIMEKAGILEMLLPELHEAMFCEQNNPYHYCTVGEHSIATAAGIEADPTLRCAAILHDLGKLTVKTTEDGIDHFYGHPKESEIIAKRILARFKFSNNFINDVAVLISEHDREMPSKKSIRRFIGKYDIETFQKLMLLKIADACAHSQVAIPELLSNVERTINLATEVVKEQPKNTYKFRDLAINGDDLKSLGIEQGPEIGRLLNIAYDMVLEDPKNNNKELLLNAIKNEQ